MTEEHLSPAPLPPDLLPPGLPDRLNEWFYWLHRHPELSFQERETAAYVADRLRELGYAPRVGVGVSHTAERLHSVDHWADAVVGMIQAGLTR